MSVSSKFGAELELKLGTELCYNRAGSVVIEFGMWYSSFCTLLHFSRVLGLAV